MSLTDVISVDVKSEYLKDRLPEEEGKFAFAYHIRIHNAGEQAVQLMYRHWLITDANGKTSEVSGPGVVGQQPVIEPGKSYQYSSGAILETPVGTMQGHYEMDDLQGNQFHVPIPVFGLAVPNLIN